MNVPAFYEASLRALRFVEARSPTKRRFGPDADAMWKGFKGHLTAADRLDLLLRDADIEYAGAFGARVAFAMPGVAEDDAFGPEWKSLSGVDADALWRRVLADALPSDVASGLTACARAWGIDLRPLDVAPPKPAERLLVVGPSAIVATAARFEGKADLSWSAQVTCLATPPSHRQLAALAAAFLQAPRPPAIVAASNQGTKIAFDRIVASDDADPADAARRAGIQG